MSAITLPPAPSAAELVAGLRAGRLHPRAVVEATIARIICVDPHLRAVAQPCFDSARAEADRLAALPLAERGTLAGLPITVKGSFDVAGVVSACGLTSRAQHVPAVDAPIIARLRAAGAIIVATTTVPDNCWAQETFSSIDGRTVNPWDRQRAVGGSTGGEAALIAAGASPFGIGSDIAGSIRLPAAFCGIVGLRLTSASLPADGHWPPATGAMRELLGFGPMARTVSDVALVSAILRQQEPRLPDPALVQRRRLLLWHDNALAPASRAMRQAVTKAGELLAAAGMQPVAAGPRARHWSLLGWVGRFGRAERAAVARGFGNGVAWSPFIEAGRALIGCSRIGWPALIYWCASHYSSLLLNAIGIDGQAMAAQLRQQFLDLIDHDGLAICPVFPTTAPRHGYSWHTWLTTIGYQVWVNLAGLPALTVPLGQNRRGMPVGIQIVAGPHQEDRLLAAGAIIEAARSRQSMIQ